MAQPTLEINGSSERFVQPGRICLIIYGRHYRKLVAVVDFIDRNKVLVDGANGSLSDVPRVAMQLKRLQCTKFRINVRRDVHPKELEKVVKDTQILQKWEQTAAGNRNKCIKRREELNDFGRFKLYYIKGQFNKAVARELLKLRADKLKTNVKDLKEKERTRAKLNPVLRRVVGKFERKLKSRLIKKQSKAKKRLHKYKKFYQPKKVAK